MFLTINNNSALRLEEQMVRTGSRHVNVCVKCVHLLAYFTINYMHLQLHSQIKLMRKTVLQENMGQKGGSVWC